MGTLGRGKFAPCTWTKIIYLDNVFLKPLVLLKTLKGPPSHSKTFPITILATPYEVIEYYKNNMLKLKYFKYFLHLFSLPILMVLFMF